MRIHPVCFDPWRLPRRSRTHRLPTMHCSAARSKRALLYREVQKAEFARKQAEDEYRQADASHKAAQKRADELKGQAEAAQTKFDAAKAREAAARKTYEAAVEAVDKIPPPAGKNK